MKNPFEYVGIAYDMALITTAITAIHFAMRYAIELMH